MSRNEQIIKALQESIITVLDLEPGVVTKDSHLVDDLGVESIDFLDISSELEKAIDIEVDFTDLASSKSADLTVGSVANYIESLLAA